MRWKLVSEFFARISFWEHYRHNRVCAHFFATFLTPYFSFFGSFCDAKCSQITKKSLHFFHYFINEMSRKLLLRLMLSRFSYCYTYSHSQSHPTPTHLRNNLSPYMLTNYSTQQLFYHSIIPPHIPALIVTINALIFFFTYNLFLRSLYEHSLLCARKIRWRVFISFVACLISIEINWNTLWRRIVLSL